MGHWYTKEGEAMHWVTGANGKERDTTLRDARKLNLLPSVTEIINVIDKPALTNWKLKQVTRAAWVFGDTQDYNLDEYHGAVMADAFEDSTNARDRGSEIHNCLELILGGNPIAKRNYPDDIYQVADTAYSKLIDYCETAKFEPEKIVVGNGYAGMVDAHNDDFVIDWKTKDIDDVTKRMAWDEQAMQLAAYQHALGMTTENYDLDFRCINVFIDRTEPGKIVIHEWKPEEIELAWQKFELLLKYWQLSKNYSPEL